MRDALVPLEGQRIVIQATVLKQGKRIAWTGLHEPTILLGEVRTPDGVLLTDHVWLPLGRRLAALDAKPGDVVQLAARVRTYQRRSTEADYGLTYPSACSVLARAPEAPLPDRAATAPARILATICTLWQESGQPPSLVSLAEQSGMRPWKLLRQVQQLAQDRAIVLLPDGHVFPARMKEMYAS